MVRPHPVSSGGIEIRRGVRGERSPCGRDTFTPRCLTTLPENPVETLRRKRPFPCRLVVAALAAATLAPTSGAAAQALAGVRFGFHSEAPSASPAHSLSFQETGGTPRWIKWGLVGAAAGALTFALLSGTDTDGDRNATKDAAVGAVFGFAILGGAIAFYDWVCKPGSGSQRAGLC